jgi:hypothetical protein
VQQPLDDPRPPDLDDPALKKQLMIAGTLGFGCAPALFLAVFGFTFGMAGMLFGVAYFAMAGYALLVALLLGRPAYLALRNRVGPRRAFRWVVAVFTLSNCALLLWFSVPPALGLALWQLTSFPMPSWEAALPTTLYLVGFAIALPVLAAGSFLLALMLARAEGRSITSFLLREP